MQKYLSYISSPLLDSIELHIEVPRLSVGELMSKRILKVARTIADLEAVENIQMHHVTEAINYRTMD